MLIGCFTFCDSLCVFLMSIVLAIPLPIPPSTLLFNGNIASGPASPPPINVLPTAPNIVGLFIIPPRAFHFMLNFGTDGGIKLNLPLKLNLGNFGILILGNFKLKPLKNPLILSRAPFIKSLAAVIGFVIAFLTELKIFVAVFFIVLNPLDTLLVILDKVLENILLIKFQPFENTPLNRLKNVLPTFRILPMNHKFINPQIIWTAPLNIPLTESQTPDQLPVKRLANNEMMFKIISIAP